MEGGGGRREVGRCEEREKKRRIGIHSGGCGEGVVLGYDGWVDGYVLSRL